METVSDTIFDEAQAQVFRLMETDSLPRFKQSKIFRQYVEAMAEGTGGAGHGRQELLLSQQTARSSPSEGSRSGNGVKNNKARHSGDKKTTATNNSNKEEPPDKHGIELATAMGSMSRGTMNRDKSWRGSGGRGGHHLNHGHGHSIKSNNPAFNPDSTVHLHGNTNNTSNII